MNLNKAILIGRLTRDPEIKSLPSGQKVATFGLATSRFYNDKSGQKQQQTDFHNIVLFARLAEIAGQYLAKGALVMIEGRIQTRSWDDQSGIKKYRTEIIGQTMQLGPRGGEGNHSNAPKLQQSSPARNIQEDEIPIIEEASFKEDEEINIEDIPF